MSRLGRAAVVGAVVAIVFVTWGAAPRWQLLLDPFLYVVYAFIALAGAFGAVSIVLAWRHTRESPRWLLAALLGILLVSMPSARTFIREMQETQRFLASADSTTGVVADKYVRGGIQLIVEFEVAGHAHRLRRVGANPWVGTPAFSKWQRGDSIPVYYHATAPEAAMVGHPGPDPRRLIESLVKLWCVCGVLLMAYLPLGVRRIRRWAALRGAQIRQAQT